MNPAVAEWVALAEADYGTARREHSLPAGSHVSVVCFHAQQCAEKMIKALLVHHNIEPPRVHDLTHLVALLPPGAPALDQADLDTLEPGAVLYRYPGMRGTPQNAAAALAACGRVRATIRPRLIV